MSDYLSPEQVCELIPGMTRGNLAQLRHAGGGPVYSKPTPRVVVYARADVQAWIEASKHSRSDQPITADPTAPRQTDSPRIRAVA